MATNIEQLDLTLSTLQQPPTQTAPITFRPTKPLLPMPGPISEPRVAIPEATPTVPAGANPSGQNGIPFGLLTLAAIQTPVKVQTATYSNITISFTRVLTDTNYDHVNIWVVGYHGGTNPVLVASGTTAPFNFILDATGEKVKVYAQTVSSSGLAAPVQFALSTTVTLSGIVSAPPAPTISQSLVGTPTGYQFGFNQVVLPGGDQEVIANYNVYRGNVNSFGSASLLGTIVANPGLTGAITFTDTVVAASGAAYFYWVTAVNTAGFESTATAAQSGTVAGSVGSLPPSISTPFKITTTSTSVTITTSPSCFFTRADGTQVVIGQTSMACTGLPANNVGFFFPYWRETDQTLQWVKGSDLTIPNITGVAFTAASSQYIETTTGASIPTAFTLELWIKGTTAGALADYSAPQVGGTTTASIMQLQATSAGEIEFSIHDSGTWVSLTTSGASVLDGTWHHIMVTFGAASGSIYVDGANTSDDVTFWTNNSMGTPLTTTGFWHFGFIGGLSGAPITSNLYNGFTISHIALYTVALSEIQAAAHMQAFANLGESFWLAETTYDSAANVWKLTETSGTTAADSVGSNTGTYKASPTLNQTSSIVTILGTPADAFPYNYLLAIQAQQLRNHTPLSNGGLMGNTATTGSQSGGGSGGGSGSGGRGGGYCFTADTLIKTQRGNVRIAEIVPGDLCLTAKGTWLPVKALIEHKAEKLALHHMQFAELVTFSHKVLRGSQWVNAGLVFPNVVEVFAPVYTIMMDSDEPLSEMMSPTTERSFTLSSGLVAHNSVIIK